ncbi:MFS transporter [Streptomyces hilarionis]|uniref:MFS transporter n=1 Tax=Streptomyces hilarionis TaxID=2839954 RepID=UPI002119B7D1|nr:MFS transporter [Streptomyces hilarionis]MCQ9129859.1 MFS transporter [Streptomyces hilarionis]
MTDVLRRGRASLAFSFFAQGAAFALLVTRIPAIQDRYGVSDALLPVFLAAVPVLAGVGSVTTEQLVKRIPPSVLLRWSQPVVLLALVGVGAGHGMAGLGTALAVFGLAVGALDASMNMLGVSLQRTYGRSIMLGFHAVYSLGGIVGASLAWVGAHWHLALWVSYLPVVAVLLPAALAGSRWYVDGDSRAGAGAEVGADGSDAEGESAAGGGSAVVFRLLLPLCLVMTFAYIGDSTVSNWSAKYLQDVLGSSEQLATVPYNVYMVTTLLGRAIGDFGVRRFGAAAVVRVGALGDAWSYRGAMAVPMVLVLVTLVYARSFAPRADRYGGGHERPRTADVGRGSNGL